MNKFIKQILSVFLFTVVILCSAFSEDSLLLSDVPVVYGKEEFIKRINQRTNGEREPVGLVLTGGSARAFAHIGVLKYLEEHGIVPDFIVSNSMGSIIAMLYAAGLSPDQILKLCTEVDLSSLFDLTLPVGRGLMDCTRFESLISSCLGEKLRLEQLKIPVLIVSEDLISKRQVHICEGDFYTVFTASYALPVFFSSVMYNGHRLVDGGIANIAPVSVAYDYSHCLIVSTTFYSGKNLNLKNPITALNTSIDIGKRREGVKDILSHPDSVWIRCDVEDFSFMDFSSGAELAQRGYESASEKEEDLNKIEKNRRDDEFDELRSYYERRISDLLAVYQPFSYTGYRKFTYSFPLSGLNYDNIHGFDLRNGFSLGTGLSVAKGIFDAQLLASFNASMVSDSFFIKPELQLNLKLQLFSFLKLSLNISYDFGSVLYLQGNLEARILIKNNYFLVTGLNGEADFDLNKKNLISEPSFYIYLLKQKKSRFNLSPHVVLSYSSLKNRIILKSFVFMDVIPEDIPVGFSLSPYFNSDLFTGSSEILTGAEVKLFYIFRESPTFAEVVKLNNLRVGFYAQYGADITREENSISHNLEVGAFTSLSLGIIGLNEIPMELFIGYDALNSKGLRGGFRIPLLY